MNRVIMMGRLTRDPMIKEKVARYTIAVDRDYKREGEDNTDFFNCVVFSPNSVKFTEKFLKKGTKILIEGRLQSGSYTNKEGQKVYTTDIVVERQEFAESKKEGGQQNGGNAGQQNGSYNQNQGGQYNTPPQNGGYNQNQGGQYNAGQQNGGYNQNQNGQYNTPPQNGGYNQNQGGQYNAPPQNGGNNRNQGGQYNAGQQNGGYNQNQNGQYNSAPPQNGGFNPNQGYMSPPYSDLPDESMPFK